MNDENIIKDIYYNNLNLAEEQIKNAEYQNILETIRRKEKELIEKNRDIEKEIKEFLECVTIRESIESENQFVLGFKTAVKIITEALKNTP